MGGRKGRRIAPWRRRAESFYAAAENEFCKIWDLELVRLDIVFAWGKLRPLPHSVLLPKPADSANRICPISTSGLFGHTPHKIKIKARPAPRSIKFGVSHWLIVFRPSVPTV